MIPLCSKIEKHRKHHLSRATTTKHRSRQRRRDKEPEEQKKRIKKRKRFFLLKFSFYNLKYPEFVWSYRARSFLWNTVLPESRNREYQTEGQVQKQVGNRKQKKYTNLAISAEFFMALAAWCNGESPPSESAWLTLPVMPCSK